MKKRILIACDHLNQTERVIGDLKCAGLAKEAEVLVLSVADMIGPPLMGGEVGIELPETYAALIRNAERQTRAEIRKALTLATQISQKIKKAFPSWKCGAVSCADSPAWAIVKKAESWGADLIVVGSHGTTPLGQIFIGSVTLKVVAEAPCSVRVVRGRIEEKAVPVRLIVGIDGSPDSAVAVQEVAARSWKKGSLAHLISAVDRQATLYAFSSVSSGKKIQKSVKSEHEWLNHHLEEAAKKLRKAGLSVMTLIREGDPKKMLIEESKSWGADAVFLGARGLHGFERFLIGSVSTAVSARAQCAVEIVRAKKKASSPLKKPK